MSNLIPIVAIIIACAVIMLLIIRKFIKDEIAENNDLIRRFRELAKTDSFISKILEESGCDENSLQIYDLKTITNFSEYHRNIRRKKEKFIDLLDMPCIKYMNSSEIINRYVWCTHQHGVKNCEICSKNKTEEPQYYLEGDINNPFSNYMNPY